MEYTTEYRVTIEGSGSVREQKWVDDFLKYLLASFIMFIMSLMAYCVFKVIQHRCRIRKARNAQKRYADKGFGATDDLPPPPPPEPEPDAVSSTSDEYVSLPASSSAVEAPQVVITTTAGSAAKTVTTSSTRTVPTPSAAAGMAANMFRRAAQAVGYPTGVPLDPSATGVGIVHDQPVAQAADYHNPDKRLRAKKKQGAPPTAPKPTSPPRRASPSRLAPPRRSARLRNLRKANE